MASNKIDIVISPSDTVWVTYVVGDMSIYTVHRTKLQAKDFADEYDFLGVGSIEFGSPTLVIDLDDDDQGEPSHVEWLADAVKRFDGPIV